MPSNGVAIVHRTGTYRTATVEQTWARIRPMLSRFGITRVADITRLDEIGLPVHLAYRPTGHTLAVSVGTGLGPTQSRVSAVMESIEAWHAENPRLEIAVRAPAEGLRLPYDPRALQLTPRSPLTDSVVLDWVVGRGLLTGAEFLVPYDTIRLDFTARQSWARALFRPSSNGLASGNTHAEATLHALHEIIERDCITQYTVSGLEERRYVDPASSSHPDTKAILAALQAAGCWVEVCDISNELDVPCYASSIWSVDVPLICGGFGCHVSPDIALGRAMSEAAQSRITMVAGARDDIDNAVYVQADPLATPPRTAGGPPQPVRAEPVPGDTLDELIVSCAQRILASTGVEPFAVDLSHPDIGIAVSKVFAPGLRLFDERALATRPEPRRAD
jgi:YcaO-like protein with predicted kinase domain